MSRIFSRRNQRVVEKHSRGDYRASFGRTLGPRDGRKIDPTPGGQGPDPSEARIVEDGPVDRARRVREHGSAYHHLSLDVGVTGHDPTVDPVPRALGPMVPCTMMIP